MNSFFSNDSKNQETYVKLQENCKMFYFSIVDCGMVFKLSSLQRKFLIIPIAIYKPFVWKLSAGKTDFEDIIEFSLRNNSLSGIFRYFYFEFLTKYHFHIFNFFYSDSNERLRECNP